MNPGRYADSIGLLCVWSKSFLRKLIRRKHGETPLLRRSINV